MNARAIIQVLGKHSKAVREADTLHALMNVGRDRREFLSRVRAIREQIANAMAAAQKASRTPRLAPKFAFQSQQAANRELNRLAPRVKEFLAYASAQGKPKPAPVKPAAEGQKGVKL